MISIYRSGQSVVNVSIGNTALTTSIYRNQIALYSVFRVRGETEGYFNPTTATFATEAQKQAIIGFLPSFVAFNGYTGPLVDSSPVVALNAGQPSLSYAGVPSVSYFNLIPGNTYSGSLPLRGYIHANVGVYGNYTGKNAQGYIDGHSSNVMIYVDGAYYRAISPAAYAGDAIYTTYAWIDTSQFTNGPHTITVYVIDNLGSQASASIAVNFLN